MATINAALEDWNVLVSFFPSNWKQLAHLPKSDEQSAKAWLYGKLFVALLTNKLIKRARTFSPWGYALPSAGESLA